MCIVASPMVGIIIPDIGLSSIHRSDVFVIHIHQIGGRHAPKYSNPSIFAQSDSQSPCCSLAVEATRGRHDSRPWRVYATCHHHDPHQRSAGAGRAHQSRFGGEDFLFQPDVQSVKLLSLPGASLEGTCPSFAIRKKRKNNTAPFFGHLFFFFWRCRFSRLSFICGVRHHLVHLKYCHPWDDLYTTLV